ncbi:MAG: DsrE family protein [Actinomycetota bacterium]
MRLIFFVSVDPATDAMAVASAFRLAATAAGAELAAEVRLAGAAVLVADPAYAATVPDAERLRAEIDGSARSGATVSVCPRSVQARGITADQVAALGARPRPLTEILTEVATGQSFLVHL